MGTYGTGHGYVLTIGGGSRNERRLDPDDRGGYRPYGRGDVQGRRLPQSRADGGAAGVLHAPRSGVEGTGGRGDEEGGIPAVARERVYPETAQGETAQGG